MRSIADIDRRSVVREPSGGGAGAAPAGVMTRQGWFSDEDLAAAQATVSHGPEGARVVFPIAYRNTGFDAVRGRVIQEPVYPPLGINHAAARMEIAAGYAASCESRAEARRAARADFEKRRGGHGRRVEGL